MSPRSRKLPDDRPPMNPAPPVTTMRTASGLSRSRVSGPTASSHGLDVAQEGAPPGAVVRSMVDGQDHVHHRPDRDDVALGRLATTGRLVIASIVRIPTSGTLMIGIVRFEPNQPVLSIVKVAAAEVIELELAGPRPAATSAIARLRPLIESWSASRIDRDEQPVVDGHGDAHVDRRLASSPPSVQWALKVGCCLSASTDALMTNGT